MKLRIDLWLGNEYREEAILGRTLIDVKDIDHVYVNSCGSNMINIDPHTDIRVQITRVF